MRSIVCCLIVVFATGYGSCKSASALRELQGTWIRESWEFNGSQEDTRHLESKEDKYRPNYIVKNDSLVGLAGMVEVFRARIKVDDSQSPKCIDVIFADGTHMRGIYALDGDILLVAISGKNAKRPKRFNSTYAMGKTSVYVFRRKR